MPPQLIILVKSTPVLRVIAKSIFSFVQKIKSFFQWKILARRNFIQLELGSGSKKGSNGFTTVDLGGADIYWDLRNGIPLKNNSVSMIYMSHMLEHIPYSQLIPFLNECFRVLKVGGKISICVPNAKFYIQAYMEKRYFRQHDSYFPPAIVNTGSYIDQVNYIAYMSGEHCYLFDEENLVNTLLKAGFSSAALRSFDKSIDLKERDFESIYALAIK
jgi:predicted SAM-dependent methyltransferase